MSYLDKELCDWDTSDVCNWLHYKHFKDYIQNFNTNNITGYDLCFITNEDLKCELNINNLHERLKILKEIRKLMLDSCI
jgi:hypothetical protein